MPIYSYECVACGEKLEIIRPISQSDDLPSAEEEQAVPQCVSLLNSQLPGPHVWEKRIVSAPTIIRSWGFGSKGNW